MAETHSLRIDIDASGSKRGASEYVAAISKIGTATTDMVKRSETALARLERKIGALDFKRVANDINKLNNVGINSSLVSGIDGLARAMRNIQRIPPSTISSLSTLTRLLGRFNTSTINVSEITAISNALGGFRAPTSTQIRNLQSFIGVIQNLQPVANSGAIVTSIQNVTNAIARLRAAMQGLNTGGPGTLRLPNVVGGNAAGGGGGGAAAAAAAAAGSGGGWTRAYGGMLRQGNAPIPSYMGLGPGRSSMAGMRGFENQFSMMYQAGSAIRTAAGALTLGNFLSQIIEATDQTAKFRSALTALGLPAEQVREQMDRITATVRQYGLNLRDTQNMYSGFAHAATSAGVSLESTNEMFDNAALSMRAMGMDRNQQEGALRALGQMFSKGRIMSEELFGQLAEHWRGFPGMIAQSLNITLPQLREAIEKNGLDPRVLEFVLRRYRESMEGAVDAAMNRPSVAIERLRTEWQLLLTEMGEGDVGRALTTEFERLANIVRSPEFRAFAFNVGRGLADVLNALGTAAQWAADNIDTVAFALKALVLIAAGNALVGLGGAVANLIRPLIVLGGVLGVAGGKMAEFFRGSAGGAAGMSRFATYAATAARVFSGPWGLVVTGLVAAGTAALALKDYTYQVNGETVSLGDVMRQLWSNGSTWVRGFVDSARPALSELRETASTIFADIARMIRETFSGVPDWLITAARRSLPGGMLTELATRGAGAARDAIMNSGPVRRAAEQVAERQRTDRANREAARRDEAQRFADDAGSMAPHSDRSISDLYLPTPLPPPRTPVDPAREGDLATWLLNNRNGRGRGGGGGSDEFANLRSRIDPSFRVMQELAESTRELDAARRAGRLTDTEYTQLQGQLRDRMLESVGAIDPMVRAQRQLAEVTGLADGLQRAGLIDLARRNEIVAQATERLRDNLNPYQEQMRLLREEGELLGMNTREMETERQVRQIVNQLRERGQRLTEEETKALRDQIETNRQLAETQRDREAGLTDWANSFRSLGTELQKLEGKIAGDLTDALAEFVTTGKADFNSLAQSIVRDINRLIIQQGIRSLLQSLGVIQGSVASGFSPGGMGGSLIGLAAGALGMSGFGGMSGASASATNAALGAMGDQFDPATAGAVAAAASSSGSGGILGSLFSWIGGLFSEGGYATNPVAKGVMPAAAFLNAPQYASGTPNTKGGIPAILHPNEAVIPLSRNRRVPVEMKGGGGANNIVFNITTPDADSFRRSQGQIMRDLGTAMNRTMRRNG